MGQSTVTPVTPDDYQLLARRRLPRFLADYIDGGCNEEITLRANIDALAALRLRQRVLRDVSQISTEIELFGRRCALPLALAPVGMAGMMARRGEAMAARVAAAAALPFTLSTVGICPLEEVAEAGGAAPWFQLYMLRDREAVKRLLERAQGVGCDTLMFTVDLPMPGMRHGDVRNGMLGGSAGTRARARLRQLAARPGWLFHVGVRGKPHSFGCLTELIANPRDLNDYKAWIDTQFDPSVTWDDIAWLRERWPGRLLLKGILDVEDARSARAVGADGIVVSNHGGRQLDGVAASIDKLPAIAEAVGEEMTVLMDGGIRSGLDIAKALALGARAVLIGRPWVWAAAAAGESGLAALLETFRSELAVGMALMGVNRVEELGPAVIDPH